MSLYAILEAGGRQWKVQAGTRLDINRISAEVGATHALERVLMASDGQQIHVGRPYVEGARILCEVVEHRLGPKTIAFRYRRRENWRRTVGHRQPLTRLVVKDLQVPGASAPATAAEATHSTTAIAPPKRARAAKAPAAPPAARKATIKKPKAKTTKEPADGA